MTFQSLSLLIILGFSACLKGIYTSTTTIADPDAYTTIRNTIDVMKALTKPTQGNITGNNYGGRNNVYHREKYDGIVSDPSISKINHQSASPDGPILSETLPRRHHLYESGQSSSVSGPSAIVAGGRDFPSISYVRVDSGPSIRISSNPPSGVHTISYTAPGGVLISHGYPGSSYVVSSQLHRPDSYIHPSNGGGVFRNRFDSSFANVGRPVTVFATHDSDPPGSSAINLVPEGSFSSLQTAGVDQNAGHLAQLAVVYRNLQMAKDTVAGISTAVSRALDNLAWIGV